MKPLFFVLVLILLFAMILPVSVSAAATYYPNTSLMQIGENYDRNMTSVSSVYTTAQTCNAYGYPNAYTLWEPAYYNETLGSWYSPISFNTFPQNFNLKTYPLDALLYSKFGWVVTCNAAGSPKIILEANNYYNASFYYPQEPVNFTGTPTTGPAPTSVVFVISNFTRGINAGSQTVLSFGDGQQATMTTATTNHTYSNPGNYTVFLEYYNITNTYSTILKPNYITIGAPNATKTKYFQTIDGTNGNIVLNSSIQLNDVENSSWTNATGLINDGMSSITTLEGHTINAYAQALGYSDSDDLGIINDGQPQYIMMWPTFAKNVSAGNVSLYVTVKDKDTKANIVGAGVTASLSTGGVQSTTTNEAGIAYFIVTNNTVALITAQAIGQGYQTATTTINTGTGSGGSASAAATILLGKNTVIPTFQTVTTLPGGGIPTPTITILPGCEDTISAEGQAKCRTAQSNQGLSFLAANMGDLIMICVFVTMLYLLGIKLGR